MNFNCWTQSFIDYNILKSTQPEHDYYIFKYMTGLGYKHFV